MKRYLYNYETIVRFSEPVMQHAVMLRCQPAENAFQTVEQEHLVVSPDYWLRQGVDGFGNRILYGGSPEPQATFAYVSTGIVATSRYVMRPRGDNMLLYTKPSRMTGVTDEMHQEARRHLTDTADTARALCHRVHELLDYVPSSTSIDTVASKVFEQRQGVCQDYAHLMIALCRADGIAARYVNGFLAGTGETHAWVEVFDGYSWTGYDPTHDCANLEGYVKVAHGRDSADCPVSRGMFNGQAAQETIINVTLQEL